MHGILSNALSNLSQTACLPPAHYRQTPSSLQQHVTRQACHHSLSHRRRLHLPSSSPSSRPGRYSFYLSGLSGLTLGYRSCMHGSMFLLSPNNGIAIYLFLIRLHALTDRPAWAIFRSLAVVLLLSSFLFFSSLVSEFGTGCIYPIGCSSKLRAAFSISRLSIFNMTSSLLGLVSSQTTIMFSHSHSHAPSSISPRFLAFLSEHPC